ncbi:YceD family protein [Actinocorallia sp. A-T 12471]|uniref:YceD family protein n=1 Tax=Actinocorallia sp. A-T 12471 TaxID=3089813 RepID=UPI0029D1BE99|nr:YceD family protein [Actinocorallia sp. A-T 12471]MDX6739099.1 YceD family protein [Actinocorallia sp. A-T 12471]
MFSRTGVKPVPELSPEGGALSSLDPKAPLVVDTRTLGRRPGSMKEQRITPPAPEGLGVEMVGVPTDAEIEVDLRLESVMEGVLVSGTAFMPIEGECARCLDDISFTLEVDFQELFVYDDTRSGAGADDDERRLDGDLLDLEPVLRDAAVLALPLSPLCQDDCPGLCAECGERLADAGPEHSHDVADPRWAALQGLAETREESQEG